MVLNSTFVLKKEIATSVSVGAKVFFALLVICAIALIIMAISKDRHASKYINENKIGELMFVNVAAIIAITLTISAYQHLTDKEYYSTTSLTEIKDAITVENDKVSIAPLTQFNSEYQYAGTRNSDQKQIFKLEEDNFYERYQLVDQNGNKLSIDREEYKMLNDKRHKQNLVRRHKDVLFLCTQIGVTNDKTKSYDV